MRDVIARRLLSFKTQEEKYAHVREYLQELILALIEKQGAMPMLAFVGGTALRIIYDLPRFSEDLDFSQVSSDFDFLNLLHFIKKELTLYGFSVNLTRKEVGAVKNGFIKFSNLLHPLGLSPHSSQLLSIKLEMDTNPPAGYALQRTVINKTRLMYIQHFDLPSLFAGKCHAILCRPYAKGRDFFDLLWFIGKKIKPNYLLLTNAYHQTQHKDILFDPSILRKMLIEKIETVTFKDIIADVEPFLPPAESMRYFTQNTFISAVKSGL